MKISSSVNIMEYRKLGRTDLNISLLGFGASPLGDVYSVTDPAEGQRAVALAVDLGINFFDVSPYYGTTLAEERLGKALRGRRQKVVLATKCGRYGLDDFNFSAQLLAASFDHSLERLQTDYIDLFQLHDVEFGDVNQIIGEAIPALRRLQEQGKARYIGITGYSLKTLLRIAEAVPVDSILSYCRYNLLVTDMDDFLTPFAEKHDIGLVNASGLHMGVLTKTGAPLWHPAPSPVKEAAHRAVLFCQDRGIDISEVALRFCLDHPYVSSTLVGMCTQDEVRRNLDAMQSSTDPEIIREIRGVMEPALDWVWPSGRIENHG